MGITDSVEKDRKSAKICGWIATMIYIPLFPILLMITAAIILIFDNLSRDFPLGLSIIFLYLAAAISVPVTFYRIWSCYLRGEYQKSRCSCLIPIVAILIASIYHTSVQVIEFLFS